MYTVIIFIMILELFTTDWFTIFYSISDLSVLSHPLYLSYSLVFLLVSVILLIVMVGVVTLIL